MTGRARQFANVRIADGDRGIFDDPPNSRFLSQDECAALASRVSSFRTGGGESRTEIASIWRGGVRFARNQIRSSGDRRNNDIRVIRNIDGAEAFVMGNQIDDDSLRAMVLRAERLLKFEYETGDVRFQYHTATRDGVLPDKLIGGQHVNDDERSRDRAPTDTAPAVDSRQIQLSNRLFAATMVPPERIEHPTLFFESTMAMSSPQRAAAIGPLVAGALKAGMLASGYMEVSATGTAVIDTYGTRLYYPMTEAEYTVTVRDPDGTGSGWAGVNWNDWNRVGGEKISAIALDKCLRSRNPARAEPGRYTAILEPQAVHDVFWPLMFRFLPEREWVKKKVIDERLTVTADPMDPDCGFLPVDIYGRAYHAATWIERGIGKDLPYGRLYAIRTLQKNTGLPNSFAYHMRPAEGVRALSIDEMIANTDRGVLVTHFWLPSREPGLDLDGYTRDGTWLIEKGKITKPVKNFKFSVNVRSVFNNVIHVGEAQRVYSRSWPQCPAAVAPALTIRDFNFTALTDAV